MDTWDVHVPAEIRSSQKLLSLGLMNDFNSYYGHLKSRKEGHFYSARFIVRLPLDA